MEPLDIWQTVAVILGPAGAVWAVLNGTRTAVRETREDVKEIRTTLGEHGERLAAIEAKVDP